MKDLKLNEIISILEKVACKTSVKNSPLCEFIDNAIYDFEHENIAEMSMTDFVTKLITGVMVETENNMIGRV